MLDKIKEINNALVYMHNYIIEAEKDALVNSPYNELTFTEIHVIEAVGIEPKTMKEVASKLKITMGSLTTSVNRIVQKGYIERKFDKADRRRIFINLTPRGVEVYNFHEIFHENIIGEITKALEEINPEVLNIELQKLVDVFQRAE
ncbi:MarR family winged helix-turn-helix transcriptional regulator [Cellulosilyticum ruminicola]|uniref:MarR family winged helix-turn-helix transcriptional regulator n=1 Tax=Cellulosilyticum ruminicola TaxID=425254 RepID=UPI0006D25CAB|nr:MarR family transcriptional regulator [Cellulosilyticum ruminicola]